MKRPFMPIAQNHSIAPKPAWGQMRIFMAICALVFLACLAGCSQSDDDFIALALIDDEPKAENYAAQFLNLSTAQGLVKLDRQGRILPGLASRWMMTDDGMSYIFRLKNLQWTNGQKVTAQQISQYLSTAYRKYRKNGRLAADLRYIAEIRPMADRIIEIKLLKPKADLLFALAQPELTLRHNGLGTGEAQLMKQDDQTILVQYLDGNEEVRPSPLREISVRKSNMATALGNFKQGEINAIFGGRFHHLGDWQKSGIDKQYMQTDNVQGFFGLLVRTQNPLLDEPHKRKAISMAIDRAKLPEKLGLERWSLEHRIIPWGANGYQSHYKIDWMEKPMESRLALARAQLGATMSSLDKSRHIVSIFLTATGQETLLFQALKSEFANIGITLYHSKTAQSADLLLIDETAPFSDPTWYLARLGCRNIGRTCGEYDTMVEAASRATDPELREQWHNQAEEIISEDYRFIPLGQPIRWSVIQPFLRGYVTQNNPWHPLFDILPPPNE